MQVTMPKLGLTMTHGTITEWLKAPGDAVRAEEALCVYETEKVSLELPSPQDGVVTQILAPVGEAVAAGTPVCVVETADDGRGTTVDRRPTNEVAPGTTLPLTPYGERRTADGGSVSATPKARALARQLGVDLREVGGHGPEGRIQAGDVLAMGAGRTPVRSEVKATPLARRVAAAEGLDLRAVSGSGPDGAITREDVEEAIKGQVAGVNDQAAAGSHQEPAVSATRPAPVRSVPVERALSLSETVVPLTSLRRVIGERMSQSAFSAPHVTLMTEAEATQLVSARSQLNEELAAGGSEGKIAFNTLIAALVARALREHPQLNSRLDFDGIHLLSQINIALAVDTERGLMTPVLHGVDGLSLPAVQRGYDILIGRAMAGRSLPDDFMGGTFTITNLGALDVDGFTPIINPPQAAIMGVGRIVEKPVAREGAVAIRPMVALSLSFDHRIVDGAPAARFLQRVKQLVERPMALLV